MLPLLLGVACDSDAPSPPGVTVEYLPTETVRANGSVTGQNVVGTKRIGIRVEAVEPNRLLDDGAGVQVAYRFPERTERVDEAEPGDDPGTFTFDLPDSDNLDICEKMLYRWTVIYDRADTGTRGTFIGEEKFVRPDQSPGSRPGELEQALCAD